MRATSSAGVAIPAIIVLGAAGCGGAILNSAWRCHDIAIDGAVEDWGAIRAPVDEQNLILSVLNDGEYLYLTLTPGDDAQQRQVALAGLVVWFDPRGGEDPFIGIRFPLGAQGRCRGPGGAEGPLAREGSAPDLTTLGGRERFVQGLDSLEVLRAGSRIGDRFAVEGLGGVAVRADLAGDVLVYELRMPLVRSADHPYAIGAAPGDLVGLGIETPVLSRLRPRGAMRGARGPGGGSPGGPGPPGGEGGGPGRFGSPDEAEPLEIWLKLRLAMEQPCDPDSVPPSGSQE